MPIRLNGATSGYVELRANGAAANNTLSLPDTAAASLLPNISPTMSNPTVTGTATMADVNASGNIGIGTNSPTAKVDIVGTAGALTNMIVRCSDANMARLTLSNTNRNWSVSNYGTQFAPNGSFNIADETAGAVRLSIDSSGRMTLPAQPAFHAIYSGASNTSISSTGSAVVIWNTASVNTGSNYSTSTGRFTAPVAGTYLFYAQIPYTSVSGGIYLGVLLQKNGSGLAEGYVSVSGYAQPHISVIVTLAANDYVTSLYHYNLTSGTLEFSPNGRGYFGGHLIG